MTTPLSTPLAGLSEGTHYWRATVRSRTTTTLNGYRQQLPASFNTDNFCAPAPTNIWGQIRVNHGTQMSAEMIAERVAPTVRTILHRADPPKSTPMGSPGETAVPARKAVTVIRRDHLHYHFAEIHSHHVVYPGMVLPRIQAASLNHCRKHG